VVQLTNYRWLADGRYVADRAKVLHNKVIQILEPELEQAPGAETLVEAVVSGLFPHRLNQMISEIVTELSELEARRILLSGEPERDIPKFVREYLTGKLKELGISYARQIPESLAITSQDIAPELISGCESLGMVGVSGLGNRLPIRRFVSRGNGREVLTIELTIDEFRSLKTWNLPNIYPVIPEIGWYMEQLDLSLIRAVEGAESERIFRIREIFRNFWYEAQKSRNEPSSYEVENPMETVLPKPVVWGFDLMTGEDLVCYPAIVRYAIGKRSFTWRVMWYFSKLEAERMRSLAQHALSQMTREATKVTGQRAQISTPAPEPAPDPVPEPAPEPVPEEPTTPVDLGGIDLSGLFGGSARQSQGNKGKNKNRR
jgi:hypothetical protein